ncbi:MAG: VWA domain-containing protein [Anaerolineae bacterium]|nr:VWA domain-containing protein [Anaerolineae bacterium]
MNRRFAGTLILAAVALLTCAAPALADGIIIIDPPPPVPMPEPVWLTIRYHRVEVVIEDQVAVTRVDQVFVNEHDWEVEGTYVFPLPEGATVSEFVMWVDGEPVEAEVLPADEARAIYEDIVRSQRDPALLEYVGRDAVRASIFPIPPGGERRVELEYTEILPVENGLVRYTYPLNTERFSDRPLEECTIHVSLRSLDPIHALYSPTHQDRIFVERDGNYRATVSYEETDVLPEKDFELVYTVNQEDVGLSLLTYREPPDDGFFLLLAAPGVDVDAARVVPRDVFLILDISGSMEGEKIAQAREALAYVLAHLNPEDRFNVIAFSSGLRQYAPELRPASEGTDAADWVARLDAIGGTDINRALLEAAAQVDPDRTTVFIFLTDGQPTEGVTDVTQILSNVAASLPRTARLFAFGVGDDVNTILLDTLAEQHRGATAYVRPDERIDEEISAFYAQVSVPVLADIELDFGDVRVEEVYPDPLPDLFAGTQLILAGRYRDPGPARITLSGEVEGDAQSFVYEGTFRAAGGDDFIPRLWAARKIGTLLTQIRLHGEEDEWVEAVIDLSVRYGIITPYTSFLIEEDVWTTQGREDAADAFRALPTPPAAGQEAVDAAEGESGLRGAEEVSEEMLPEDAAQVIRHVGSKTFVLRDGVWIDTVFDPETMTPVAVGFGSEPYFDLLTSRPEWGAYLALGQRVVFVADGAAYEVVEGAGEAVVIPPTRTPAPGSPTAEPVAHTPPSGAAPCSVVALLVMGSGVGVSASRRSGRSHTK